MAERENISTLLPAVVGPTASGKTALAIALGLRLSGEILCCDSMQIYRYMDIGTAKPTEKERAALPHHLFDLLDPGAPYSAAAYAEDALRTAREVLSRGNTPLFCGGTGLYLATACRGAGAEEPPGATALRARLQEEAAAPGGSEALYARLLRVDPASAQACHPNNTRRVIRALEIYEATGIPKSEWDRRSLAHPPAMRVLPFGLYMERDALYRRIEERVEAMFRAGLLEEGERLWSLGYLRPGTTAAAAIGYKEILPALRGEISIAEAKEALCLSTRHYAKRQMTWFMKDKSVVWLDATKDKDTLAAEAAAIYRERLWQEEKEMRT